MRLVSSTGRPRRCEGEPLLFVSTVNVSDEFTEAYMMRPKLTSGLSGQRFGSSSKAKHHLNQIRRDLVTVYQS